MESGATSARVVVGQRQKMKVMVALDESDGSFYALQWSLDNLIDGVSATNEPSLQESGLVTLVHVQQPFQPSFYPVGPGGAAAFYPPTTLMESVRKAQAENSAAILSRALKMCNEKMIKAETLILEGDAKDKISQATEQMDVDLLVVGSRGLGKIKRAFLGSVSDYCAHHAKCPILIVKPPKETASNQRENKSLGMETEEGAVLMEQKQEQRQKKKVMVALDESDTSFYALKWTLDNLIIKGVSQDSDMVTLVHVQHSFQTSIVPLGPAGAAALYTPSSIADSVKKAQQENSAAIVSRALKMCDEKMVKAESLILEGDAKDMICKATEQMQVDLVVVGSRGLGKIKRALLGSVSYYCAHHAKCPILIVKPPKEIDK
ncbi:universal stress protein MSMEG_3950/MSMEI_3859 [Jatropha curcas]|nr:universal stress protein MSMEG_3950/MSMEI_3859 [Jatropha curcas]